MGPVWLPLAGFWLSMSVYSMFKFRKTKRAAFVVAAAPYLFASGMFVFLAVQ